MNSYIPDLKFNGVIYGPKEIPWDMSCFLYRGGCATKKADVQNKIETGELGEIKICRLSLVIKIHEYLTGKLAAGASKETILNNLFALRAFYSWIDTTQKDIVLDTLQEQYGNWGDHLLICIRIKKSLTMPTAYDKAVKVGSILDDVLERKRRLISLTQLTRGKSKFAGSLRNSKQNLELTFKLGHTLLDICLALTYEVVLGPLPIEINFRTGLKLQKWCRLAGANTSTSQEVRNVHNQDKSLESRSTVINLRIETELMMFIAQTGMNLSQAERITIDNFSYTSYLNGYQVRRRKARRGGDVEFEIFEEYKNHFETYIDWRNSLFGKKNTGLLFPFIRMSEVDFTTLNPSRSCTFSQLKNICKQLGVHFEGPRAVRKTRINYLMRRSNDEDVTASMAQHSKQTLLQSYLEPNHQVAMVEIHKFHLKNDPTIAAPGPGVCISTQPVALHNIPDTAPRPDCMTAGGCIFCDKRRDVDSQDHFWSLASFRHLKTFELATFRPPKINAVTNVHPALAVVERLSLLLKQFEASSAIRGIWVKEALERIAESNYHPMWDGFIQLWEVSL